MHLSKIDQKLLLAAVSDKRSAKELSEAVGRLYSPEEALLRLKELLDASNPLSEAEERRLLILDARRVMGVLNEFVESGDIAAIGEYRRFLELVAGRLDKAMINIDMVSTKLTSAYAMVMVKALEESFKALPAAFLQQGIDLPLEQLNGIFQEVMPATVLAIESSVDE